MIDLTPLDVRKKRGDFRQKLRGYDPEEVDTFLELVEDRLEVLVKDNLTLKDKVQLLEARLETLEGREQAVQDALVSAQALRKEVQDQARRDAEKLGEQVRRETDLRRREAEADLGARFREAEDLLKERQRALEELERNRRRFLKAFRSLLEREMDSVEVEESRRPLEDAPLDLELRGWKRKEPAAAGVAKARESEALGEVGSDEESETFVAAPEEARSAEGTDALEVGAEGATSAEETEAPEVQAEGDPETEEPLWISALLDRHEEDSEGGAEHTLEGSDGPAPEDDRRESEEEWRP